MIFQYGKIKVLNISPNNTKYLKSFGSILMSMLYIGAGGWAYFVVPGLDPLTVYAKAFDCVEVNSTFYTHPSIELVKSWRRRVPDDFMFSVRCYKDLTHKNLLSSSNENCKILARSLRICHELRAEILHIQTPPSFDPGEKLKDIRDLFSSTDFGKVKPAWEIRGRITQATIDLMRDTGIIHCTDISKEMPSTDSDILYTRLFGHGEHNLKIPGNKTGIDRKSGLEGVRSGTESACTYSNAA